MSAPPGLPQLAGEVLASLAEHRVLSTPQVREIHFPEGSLRWAQQVLSRLAGAGLAGFVADQGSAGAPRRHWFATEPGARAALRAGALEAIPRLIGPEGAAGPLQAHTLALNDAAISFCRAARERGEDCGPLAWRHEVPLRLGYGRRAPTIFADAVLTYLRLTDASVVVEQRFLELDRGTLPVDRLAAELARYGRYLRARGKDGRAIWEAHHPYFPPVICVLAGQTRERAERRRDATAVLLGADPAFAGEAELSIRFCLLEDLARRGPFAPIFTDARDPEEPADWLLDEPEED